MKKLALLLTAVLVLETFTPALSPVVAAAEISTEVVEQAVEESTEILVEETVEEVVEETVEEVTEEVTEETESSTEETDEVEESVAEESVVVEESVVEESVVVEESAVEESVTEESVAEESVIEESVAEETIVEETVTAEEEAIIEEIPVAKPAPKTVVKQTYKLNTFFTHGYASFAVNLSGTTLENATLVDDTYFKIYQYGNHIEFGMKAPTAGSKAFWELTPAEQKAASKVKVHLKSEDGREWDKEFTISYTKTIPKYNFNTTSSTVYLVDEDGKIKPAGNRIEVSLVDNKKQQVPFSIASAKLVNYTDKNGTRVFSANSENQDINDLSIDEQRNTCLFYFTGEAAATAKVSVKCIYWTEPVTYSYKVTTSKKAITAKLATSKVTLNAAYGDEVRIPVSVPKSDYMAAKIGECTLLSKPKNDTNYGMAGCAFEFSMQGKNLVIRAPKNKDFTSGTYKFSIPLALYYESGVRYEPKPVTVTITVKNQEITKKDFSVKKTGSLSASKGGQHVLKATLKNVHATLVGIRFSDEDIAGGIIKQMQVYTNKGLGYTARNYYTGKAGTYTVHIIYKFQVDGSDEVIEVEGAPLKLSIGK